MRPSCLFTPCCFSYISQDPRGRRIKNGEDKVAAISPDGRLIAGGPARQLTRFATDDIWDFDWTPDNRLILARGPVNQDIVLISNRQSR